MKFDWRNLILVVAMACFGIALYLAWSEHNKQLAMKVDLDWAKQEIAACESALVRTRDELFKHPNIAVLSDGQQVHAEPPCVIEVKSEKKEEDWPHFICRAVEYDSPNTEIIVEDTGTTAIPGEEPEPE